MWFLSVLLSSDMHHLRLSYFRFFTKLSIVAQATFVRLWVIMLTVTHGFTESYSCFSLTTKHSLSHSTLTFGCVMTYFLTSSGKSNVRLGNFSESSWRSTMSGGLLPPKCESTMPGMFLTSLTFNLTEIFSVSDMAINTS